MEHSVLFENPTFHAGLNVTVRKGPKWLRIARHGDTLLLTQTNGVEQNRGLLVDLVLMPFTRIPEVWLRFEHDPACRTREGLLKELQKVYPGFKETDEVTVLLFVV